MLLFSLLSPFFFYLFFYNVLLLFLCVFLVFSVVVFVEVCACVCVGGVALQCLRKIYCNKIIYKHSGSNILKQLLIMKLTNLLS